MAIFDIINFPGRGLSSRAPILRPWRLRFLNSPVEVLCADLWFCCIRLTDSKDLYSRSVSDPCSLRTLYFVVLCGKYFRLGVHRYPPFPGNSLSGLLYSSLGNSCYGSFPVMPDLLSSGIFNSCTVDSCISYRMKSNSLLLFYLGRITRI